MLKPRIKCFCETFNTGLYAPLRIPSKRERAAGGKILELPEAKYLCIKKMGKFKACLDETGISAHLFLNYKYSRKLYNTGRQKGKPGSLCLAVEKMWFGKTTSSNRKLVFAGPNPASAWYIRTARYL